MEFNSRLNGVNSMKQTKGLKQSNRTEHAQGGQPRGRSRHFAAV